MKSMKLNPIHGINKKGYISRGLDTKRWGANHKCSPWKTNNNKSGDTWTPPYGNTPFTPTQNSNTWQPGPYTIKEKVWLWD